MTDRAHNRLFLDEFMEILNSVISVILAIGGAMMIHKTLYQFLGFVVRAKKFSKTEKRYTYSFVIAARNEEPVIGNLIDSIRQQDYDGKIGNIFVVADNCTDETAEICRRRGAVVYERTETDQNRCRKGYALKFLFECIRRDYGINSCDGYFIFDADNLLAPDFVSRMNEAFDAGWRIVTSYRNTKNFDTNFISAAYGLHFCHNSLGRHRPRSVLGIGTHLTGTGYLISSELMTDGWSYVNFTEDDEITLAKAGEGIKVGYCEAAEFFDEQPHDIITVFHQRVRWAKGRLVNFFLHGVQAFKGIFRHRSFTCYDMFTHYFPYGLFSWILGIIYPTVSFVFGLFNPGTNDYKGMIVNLGVTLATMYFSELLAGAMTAIRERRHIRCTNGKLLLYVLLFPWYTMISIPVYLVAVFKNVTWVPIKHDDDRQIESLVKSADISDVREKV